MLWYNKRCTATTRSNALMSAPLLISVPCAFMIACGSIQWQLEQGLFFYGGEYSVTTCSRLIQSRLTAQWELFSWIRKRGRGGRKAAIFYCAVRVLYTVLVHTSAFSLHELVLLFSLKCTLLPPAARSPGQCHDSLLDVPQRVLLHGDACTHSMSAEYFTLSLPVRYGVHLACIWMCELGV